MSGVRYILINESGHDAGGVPVGLRPDLGNTAHGGATGSAASSTIADTSIAATDYARPVTGTNIPAGSYVGTVVAGTSFTLANASGAARNPSGAVAGITLGGQYAAGPEENWSPRAETQWHKQFKKVVHILSVIGTCGTAPASWSLGVRFEQHVQHTHLYQDQFGIWAPLQDEQLVSCIDEGVGWYGPGQVKPTDAAAYGIVADQTTQSDDGSGVLPNGIVPKNPQDTSVVSNPVRVTVSRTVTNQLGGMRLRFLPSITGGDATTQILLTHLAIGVA